MGKYQNKKKKKQAQTTKKQINAENIEKEHTP